MRKSTYGARYRAARPRTGAVRTRGARTASSNSQAQPLMKNPSGVRGMKVSAMAAKTRTRPLSTGLPFQGLRRARTLGTLDNPPSLTIPAPKTSSEPNRDTLIQGYSGSRGSSPAAPQRSLVRRLVQRRNVLPVIPVGEPASRVGARGPGRTLQAGKDPQ